MPRDIAFRCWLAARPMIVACLMVACATATNTPAQDEAWRRWEACSGQTRGADLRSVQFGHGPRPAQTDAAPSSVDGGERIPNGSEMKKSGPSWQPR
jgi:hypothetical protein